MRALALWLALTLALISGPPQAEPLSAFEQARVASVCGDLGGSLGLESRHCDACMAEAGQSLAPPPCGWASLRPTSHSEPPVALLATPLGRRIWRAARPRAPPIDSIV